MHTADAKLFKAQLSQAAPAQAQAQTTDGISSCGSAWMPRDDVTIAQGTDSRTGFHTAVQKFCAASNGKVVPAGGYLSMVTEVFLNGGKDPKNYGVLGFVYCLSIWSLINIASEH